MIDKLRGGADLMAPGVMSIDPSHNTTLPLQENQLVCVRAYGRDQDLPPMAIGKMAMTSDLVEKTDKGKAVLTLHSYGDTLWERGGKGEPPNAILRVMRLAGQVPVDAEVASDPRPPQEEIPGESTEAAEPPPEEGVPQSAAEGSSKAAIVEQISPKGTRIPHRTTNRLIQSSRGRGPSHCTAPLHLYTRAQPFIPSFGFLVLHRRHSSFPTVFHRGPVPLYNKAVVS